MSYSFLSMIKRVSLFLLCDSPKRFCRVARLFCKAIIRKKVEHLKRDMADLHSTVSSASSGTRKTLMGQVFLLKLLF